MLDATRTPPCLPAAPGVGYKPQHFSDLRDAPGPVKWLEVHAENYMGDGGRPHAQLRALRTDFAISSSCTSSSKGPSNQAMSSKIIRMELLVT